MKITAAVVREKATELHIESLELDEPLADEVLVKIVGPGVCHTDMVVRDQGYAVPLPMVLGHEGAGIVEKVGTSVTHLKPGDHVVLSYGYCGTCSNCRAGKPGYCEDFYEHNFKGCRMDGSCCHTDAVGKKVGGTFFSQSSFASHALVNASNAVKIPSDVPLEIMGPLGCGIQTGAGAVLNALKPEAGSSIAIFGAGSVGLSAAMAAVIAGCTKIILIDVNPGRLELAKSLGATHVINGKETDAVEEIRALTEGKGTDYSLECTGHSAVLTQAVNSLRIPGLCGLIGAADQGVHVSLDINTLLFGRSVRGIIEGDSVPQIFIPRLVELWRSGKFPFDKLITFYPLSEINQAIRDSESGKTLKPVVRP